MSDHIRLPDRADLSAEVDFHTTRSPTAGRMSAHARKEFAEEPGSVAAVRAFVRKIADVNVSHPAVLVASELATNAVVHANSRFVLTIDSNGTIRLNFEDFSAALPQHNGSKNGSSNGSYDGGQGLRLVEALSIKWGVEATPTGKQVWAEVATAAP